MQRYRPQLSFVLVLVLGYVSLDWCYRQVPDQILADRVYRWAINQVAAGIINSVAPTAQVKVDAHRLVSPRATLEVVRGCDGSGLLFLLVAAVLAFTASWSHKLVGLLVASVLVYVLNEVRVITLYFVLVSYPRWFVPLHISLIPVLIMALSAMFYLWWTRWVSAAASHVSG